VKPGVLSLCRLSFNDGPFRAEGKIMNTRFSLGNSLKAYMASPMIFLLVAGCGGDSVNPFLQPGPRMNTAMSQSERNLRRDYFLGSLEQGPGAVDMNFQVKTETMRDGNLSALILGSRTQFDPSR
jgi:hypothetical protein